MDFITDEVALRIMQNIGITDKDEDIISNVKSKAALVIAYLNNGGAKISAENLSEYELGIIGNGVNDLMNNTSGGTEFSPAFKLLSMQICTVGDVKHGETTA